MRTLLLAALCATALAARGADEPSDAIKKELAALKGEWKIVSRTEDGRETPLESIKDRVIVFEGDAYEIRNGKDLHVAAKIKLEPTKAPKWFDLTITSPIGSAGENQLGLYKIEGDTLTICVADFDAKRPTEFASKEGSGTILVTYKRPKK